MQTARWAELVYGADVALDDPAETYHEASKISRNQIGRQIEGARRLDASLELQVSSVRAVRRLRGREISLPPARLPGTPLGETIRRRRSERRFAPDPLQAEELAVVLQAAYGVTEETDRGGTAGLRFRAVPSGGALYPLELFVAALRVDGVRPGLYHFDPLRDVLVAVREWASPDELAALSTYPEIVSGCGALILIAAVFWRTRFKYGLRGYRFALLEAGHVGQNIMLAATAVGVASVPLGGFYDGPTDAFLGLDGVNESTLYTVALGRSDGAP